MVKPQTMATLVPAVKGMFRPVLDPDTGVFAGYVTVYINACDAGVMLSDTIVNTVVFSGAVAIAVYRVMFVAGINATTGE